MRTGEPTVDALLRRLVGGQLNALGTDPIGIDLFGSVVSGDFESGVSDVDVAGVAASDITTSQLRALDQIPFGTKGDQAYVILTVCRGLRTIRTGEYVSKREAARWASEALPQHAELIREPLVWREHSRVGDSLERGTATEDDVRSFLREMTSLAS